MSYHILHQFDEPWPREDTADGGARRSSRLCQSLLGDAKRAGGRQGATVRRSLWLVAIASLTLAAAALLFALDARTRAADFEQRLDALERQK